MKSFLRCAALAAAMLGVQHAHGLALGGAVVSSDMSSPLRVIIPLEGISTAGVDPESVKVDVPGELEHETLGYPDPILPRDLKVRLSVDAPGGASISITTLRVTREPVLRFLVRVAWPGGQALREYALIIDPPAVAHPTASRPGALFTASNRPRGAVGGATLAAPRPSPPARAGERYGPVAAGDTLHRIASAAFPQRAGDLAPVMRAIVARNPGAFIGGDADRVLQGAFLDLPEAAQVPASTAAATATSPALAATPAGGAVAGSYVVAPGDTLYSIARRVAVADADLAGVVQRIFSENPAAFADGDMNRLLSGAVLRVDGLAPRDSATTAPLASAAAPSVASGAADARAADELVGPLRAQLRETQEQVSVERARKAQLSERLDALLARVEDLRARDAELTAQGNALSRQLGLAGATPPAVVTEVVTEPARPAAQTPAQAPAAAPATGAVREATPAPAAPVAVASVEPAAAPAAAAPAPRRTERPRSPVPPPELATGTGLMGFIAPLVAGPMGWLLLGVIVAGVLLLVLLRSFSATRIGRLEPRARADEEATARKLAEVRERHGDTGTFEADEIAPSADEKRSTVHLTDTARAGNLAKEAAVHLAYEDYTAAKACITEAIRLDPHRDEHKMVLVTVYESTGEQDKARAIVNDLLTRREQLPGELREQVEQLRQGTGD